MAKINSPILDFYRAHRTGVILVFILVTAIFFRFYQLASLPPGLHPDEAANGLDIFRILENRDWRPLYNTNGPREALFFYLQAIFVALLGNTILALRVAPALIGVLAVVATYAWSKSWFGSRVALITAFTMAVNPWAVTITRDGFRASMTPLIVPLSLWLITMAWQKRTFKWFVLAGISLGAGLYTYIPIQGFVMAIFITLIAVALFKRHVLKGLWKGVGIGIAFLALVLVPMGIYGLNHPEDLAGRAGGTSVLNPDLNKGKPVQTILDSASKTLLMFNVRGDENYRHNLGGQPQLNAFIGIMFILGILIAISNLNKPRYSALLATFAVMISPSILTAEGIPHALRAVGAIPAVLLLSAIGIEYMLERWYSTFPINSAARMAGLSAIVVLLALTGYQGYRQYFVAWANSPQTYEAYSEDAVAIGRYLNANKTGATRYVVIDGYSDKTVEYLTHGKSSYTRIDASQISTLDQAGSKEFVISPSAKNEALERFKSRFGGGRLSADYSTFNDAELFLTYKVTK